MIKIFFEISSLVYTTVVPILIYLGRENNFNYQWIFFIAETINLLIQTIFVYNILDNIYPPILHAFDEYQLSMKTKIIKYSILVFLILITLFSLFITSMYVINFEYISGNYYLQLLQPCFFAFTCFYFLNDAFSDYAGWTYCMYYQSRNERKIKFHWIPRTLESEMQKIYNGEYYFGE